MKSGLGNPIVRWLGNFRPSKGASQPEENPLDALDSFSSEGSPQLAQVMARMRPRLVTGTNPSPVSVAAFEEYPVQRRKFTSTAFVAAVLLLIVSGGFLLFALRSALPDVPAPPQVLKLPPSATPLWPAQRIARASASRPTRIAVEEEVEEVENASAPPRIAVVSPLVASSAPIAARPAASPTVRASTPPARPVASVAVEPTPPPPEPVAQSAVTINPADAAPPAYVYSGVDRDVQPPQMLSSELPLPAIASWTTRTNAIELVITETGVVDHVRLLTPPQRMTDMMLLSRAKLWKFTPATKDGRPVPYRLVLTWQVNP